MFQICITYFFQWNEEILINVDTALFFFYTMKANGDLYCQSPTFCPTSFVLLCSFSESPKSLKQHDDEYMTEFSFFGVTRFQEYCKSLDVQLSFSITSVVSHHPCIRSCRLLFILKAWNREKWLVGVCVPKPQLTAGMPCMESCGLGFEIRFPWPRQRAVCIYTRFNDAVLSDKEDAWLAFVSVANWLFVSSKWFVHTAKILMLLMWSLF